MVAGSVQEREHGAPGDEGDMNEWTKGINLTNIARSAVGATVGVRCDRCKVTTFIHCEYAIVPEGADIAIFKGFCIDYPWHSWPRERTSAPEIKAPKFFTDIFLDKFSFRA